MYLCVFVFVCVPFIKIYNALSELNVAIYEISIA